MLTGSAVVIGLAAAVFRALWIEPGAGVQATLVIAARFAALTWAFSVCLGLPAWWLLRRYGLRAPWQVTLAGAALGGLCGAALPLLLGPGLARPFFSGLYPPALEYGLFGAVAGFAGWWWGLRRPG